MTEIQTSMPVMPHSNDRVFENRQAWAAHVVAWRHGSCVNRRPPGTHGGSVLQEEYKEVCPCFHITRLHRKTLGSGRVQAPTWHKETGQASKYVCPLHRESAVEQGRLASRCDCTTLWWHWDSADVQTSLSGLQCVGSRAQQSFKLVTLCYITADTSGKVWLCWETADIQAGLPSSPSGVCMQTGVFCPSLMSLIIADM